MVQSYSRFVYEKFRHAFNNFLGVVPTSEVFLGRSIFDPGIPADDAIGRTGLFIRILRHQEWFHCLSSRVLGLVGILETTQGHVRLNKTLAQMQARVF